VRPEGTVSGPIGGAEGGALSRVDRDGRNGVRTSVQVCCAGTMIDVPLYRGAAAALLLVVWLAAPKAGLAQTAQAVRVPHDSGGAPPAGASSASGEHRYGPPESVRERDAQLEASVPTRYAPPAGMCRVWVGGVPPERQPAPTECAKAVRVRSPNSHIVFGKPRPAILEGSGGAPSNQPGVAMGTRGDGPAGDHGQPPGDRRVVAPGTTAPTHPAVGAESGSPPSGTPTTKPAPSSERAPSSHSPPHPHASSPPNVTVRPRR
jgi:hypothetical protein